MDRLFWKNISSRERMLLIISVPVILSLLLWLMLIQPIIHKQNLLKEQLVISSQSLLWMQENSSQVARRAENNRQKPHNLRQLVDLGLRKLKITQARIKSSAKSSVALSIDSVEFTKLVEFVAQLESQSIYLKVARVDQTTLSGRVSAELIFSE